MTLGWSLTPIVLLLIAVSGPALAQSRCIHTAADNPNQAARRQAALSVVRSVNEAEQNTVGASKEFRPLAALGIDVSAISDWTQHFTSDGKSYSFLLVDSLDPCRFAFFTDENGMIFHGYPINIELQAVERTPRK